MEAKYLETIAHSQQDGRLLISLETGVPDAEFVVKVERAPSPAAKHVDEMGYPLGYFDRIVGAMADLKRWPQGEITERLPLE